MNGETHENFATGFAISAVILMESLKINELHPYISALVAVNFARVGGKFPDYDLDWDKIHDKNIINFAINKFIKFTGGTHRSWQTHSFDISIIVLFIMLLTNSILLNNGIINSMDSCLLNLTVTSFGIGWISHLVCDMLNPSGVYLTVFNKNIKLKLVPKKFLAMSCSTGGTWEKIVKGLSGIIDVVLIVIMIIMPFIMR